MRTLAAMRSSPVAGVVFHDEASALERRLLAVLTIRLAKRGNHPTAMPPNDYELLAQQVARLEQRLAEVERVNARLEQAALTTASALHEISRRWDAVYDAMRREEPLPAEAEGF